MLRVAVAGVALVAIPVVASAADEPVSAATERKLCRFLTPTGTYFGTKVCKTRKEWESVDGRHEESVAKAERNNTVEFSQGKGNLIVQ